jgi:hypothetical protein
MPENLRGCILVNGLHVRALAQMGFPHRLALMATFGEQSIMLTALDADHPLLTLRGRFDMANPCAG